MYQWANNSGGFGTFSAGANTAAPTDFEFLISQDSVEISAAGGAPTTALVAFDTSVGVELWTLCEPNQNCTGAAVFAKPAFNGTMLEMCVDLLTTGTTTATTGATTAAGGSPTTGVGSQPWSSLGSGSTTCDSFTNTVEVFAPNVSIGAPGQSPQYFRNDRYIGYGTVEVSVKAPIGGRVAGIGLGALPGIPVPYFALFSRPTSNSYVWSSTNLPSGPTFSVGKSISDCFVTFTFVISPSAVVLYADGILVANHTIALSPVGVFFMNLCTPNTDCDAASCVMQNPTLDGAALEMCAPGSTTGMLTNAATTGLGACAGTVTTGAIVGATTATTGVIAGATTATTGVIVGATTATTGVIVGATTATTGVSPGGTTTTAVSSGSSAVGPSYSFLLAAGMGVAACAAM
jgi:hypothetical protein